MGLSFSKAQTRAKVATSNKYTVATELPIHGPDGATPNSRAQVNIHKSIRLGPWSVVFQEHDLSKGHRFSNEPGTAHNDLIASLARSVACHAPLHTRDLIGVLHYKNLTPCSLQQGQCNGCVTSGSATEDSDNQNACVPFNVCVLLMCACIDIIIPR